MSVVMVGVCVLMMRGGFELCLIESFIYPVVYIRCRCVV